MGVENLYANVGMCHCVLKRAYLFVIYSMCALERIQQSLLNVLVVMMTCNGFPYWQVSYE